MRKRLFGMLSTSASLTYTEHALASFFKNTALGAGDRFILIDNDGSYVHKQGSYPLELLVNATPLGFAENANQLVDRAMATDGDLILMNNDLIFSPGWFEACEEDPTNITSPLSNREVGYDLDWVKTPMTWTLEEYLEKREQVEVLFSEHKKHTKGLLKVTVLPFFCIRIPIEVLRGVGHFDERFGKGGAEDYDYCLRAQLAGFSVSYALSAFIVHFGGKSSWSGIETKEEQDRRELMFRSEFAIKWGHDLLKMCLLEDRSYTTPDSPITALAAQGKHREIVTQLLGQREIQIHL